MVLWMVEYGTFAYNSYVKNSESITAVQHHFWQHFNIHCSDAVPTRNAILHWMGPLCTQGT